jgi:ABC-2 type transport system permease protein
LNSREWAASSPARDAARLLTVTRTIAVAGFKVRYLDSLLGYVWAVARPTVLFAVLYFVFATVTELDEGVPHYAMNLFLAVVLWTFFAEATAEATPSLVARSQLMRRLPVPPIAIPMSVVMGAGLNLLMSLSAVLVVALATGVEPRLSWIQLPLLIGVLAFFALGAAMLSAIAYVGLRDVDDVGVLGRQVLFYLSPVIYQVTTLPEHLERLSVLLNPISFVLTQARHAVIDPTAPSAVAVAGGPGLALIPIAISVLTLLAGVMVFRRYGPRVAERV